MTQPVPTSVLTALYKLQFSTTDLLRALLVNDENYIRKNLSDIELYRSEVLAAIYDWSSQTFYEAFDAGTRTRTERGHAND
jgi:hypothetical protein